MLTLPAIVNGLQHLSALTWLGVSWHYSGSVARILQRRANLWDGAGCWAFACGLVQTGFTLRWLTFGFDDIRAMSPESLIVWAVLYFANAGVAIGILHTWQERQPFAANGRARNGLLMWGGVMTACVSLALLIGSGG